MTEKLINDIINILDNVYYWETCPQEYNDKIDVIKKELESELKKLRVTDVSVSVCEFGCEKCGMTFSGAQQMLLHSRICPQNVH